MSLLDTKSPGKRGPFSGKETEWSSWNFVFLSWVSMLSPEMRSEVKLAVDSPSVATTTDANVNARSSQLYHMLVLLCKGRALQILQSMHEKGEANGYEAYRQLAVLYEPKTATRTMGLLHEVLNPSWSSELGKWQEELVLWEQNIERHISIAGERLP